MRWKTVAIMETAPPRAVLIRFAGIGASGQTGVVIAP
jgi:hypothetical protein